MAVAAAAVAAAAVGVAATAVAAAVCIAVLAAVEVANEGVPDGGAASVAPVNAVVGALLAMDPSCAMHSSRCARAAIWGRRAAALLLRDGSSRRALARIGRRRSLGGAVRRLGAAGGRLTSRPLRPAHASVGRKALIRDGHTNRYGEAIQTEILSGGLGKHL
eukprot:6188854-Pleurochrysis_carterae.AAC.3